VHRALWLLIGLQLRGWLRYAKRSVSSVRGIILFLVFLFFSCGWLMSILINPSGPDRRSPESLDRWVPLLLLGGCLLNLFLSSNERVISFRPAEVDFLFAGPFTRRQLLTYKIVGIVAAAFFQGLFFLFFAYRWGDGVLPAYFGIVLLILFFQFFTLTLTMLASTVGARAYSRGRKAVLLVILLVLAAVAVQVVRGGGDPLETLERLEGSAAWQAVRTPLSWFVKAFRAGHLGHDFVRYGSLALLVDLALVAIVYALDAQYLEASAAASERQYQRLQRLRSGQGVLAAAPGSGKARFSLPTLPRMGGVGPIVWRQLLVIARSFLPLLLLLALGGVSISIALSADRPGEDGKSLAWLLAGMLVGFPVFLTPTVLCDFRGDVDRMEVLKALPIRASWLAVGQLLAPTLVLAITQAIVVTALQLVLGRFEPLLLAVPLLAVPVNFVLFAVENLLFLLFPVRIVAASPGDFQTSGRYMLIFLAKFLCLGPIILASGLVAVLVQWATQSIVAALAGAWLTALSCGIGLVPLIVLAFDRFDVASDTPT
jgi:hypothetical protein